MILFLRALPVIIALAILGGFSEAAHAPQFFWSIAIATCLVALLGMWLLLRRSMRVSERFMSLSYPALTLAGGMGVLLFSEQPSFRALLALALAAVFWIFCEQAFYFSYQPARYQPNAIVNLNILLCVLSTFFMSMVAFDLQLFAGFPLWAAVAVFSGFFLLSTILLLQLLSVPRAARWTWGAAILLTGLGCFSVLAWLPALPVVKAALLTLPCTYAVVRVREDIAGTPLPSRWSFIVAGLVLLLLLVTTRWFV